MPFQYLRYYKNELNKYAHFCKAYHKTKIFVNNKPDALFLVFSYSFHLSTPFEFLPDWHTKQSLTQTNHTRWCINTIRSLDDEHL